MRTAPTHARHLDAARDRFGAVGAAWADGLWVGDPPADALAADLAVLGRRAGMVLVERALRDGVAAVPEAPDSLHAFFAEIDRVPDWVDFDQLDRAGDHLARQSLQLGLVLAAASLMVGYTNPAAARPLILTGRLVGNAGVRNLEVGDWLREVTTPGGLRRDGLGLERTVRVRLIHAMVRRRLAGRWDSDALGTPVSQPYMAHTLSEFGCIALDGMKVLGARYTASERADIYALWRYVGYLSGVQEPLLPRDEHEQRVVQELYQLTRPEVDDDSRALVRGLVDDYLVPEVAELFPARPGLLRTSAPSLVHGLVRALVGDDLADELGIRRTATTRWVAPLGRLTAAAYAVHDLVPGGKARRVRQGRLYRAEQERRLRAKYAMEHDLVDRAPDSPDRAGPQVPRGEQIAAKE